MLKFLRGFIFCLLLFLSVSILGMMISGLLGAGEGQGLAAGAIVVGYGFMAGLVALLAAILLLRTLKKELIIRLNLILGVALVILVAILTYRFITQRESKENIEYDLQPTAPAAPISLWQSERGDEGDIGLGFFKPDFYQEKTLHFYPEPTVGKSLYEHQAYDSLVFVHSEMDRHQIAYAPPYLVPAHLKMDYDILLFRVKRMSKDYFEVVVNESTRRTAFVDRFKGGMIPWPEFLITLPSVEFEEGMIQPIKIKPLDHASEVATEKVYTRMRPESIQGFWLEVSLINENYQAEGQGWIKWRNEFELLIKYNLLS